MLPGAALSFSVFSLGFRQQSPIRRTPNCLFASNHQNCNKEKTHITHEALGICAIANSPRSDEELQLEREALKRELLA
ncbi:unnamed protein product [Zymoseptoria tritici ST99CH_3D7]|uniref:Uncharacterized protein n=1 Tax=Zymoseptoria tritici (strain ST99CH_3D7) TaxID=1276538 RepID=A0A1X7S2J6_ZYMT9|nr:unnamed protein product [Zymoseptoria tritici ST99CH_3D7]